MDEGEDTTGLGTVRDWARALLEQAPPYTGEMWFMLDGKKVSVETTVKVMEEEGPRALS